jgi:pimeloyl-ACP methyl ester carboxylesterase
LKRRATCISCTAIVAAFATGVLLISASCVSFHLSPAEVDEHFVSCEFQPTSKSLRFGERTLHWVEVGDPSRPPVLFVHGSPGTWDAFIEVIVDRDLQARAWMISVDRAGFGGSRGGGHEPSLATQAAHIAAILEQAAPSRPVIAVGHSLGGSVVARLAVDFPELVQSMVLVAPSIDPALEEHRWYNTVASWWLVSWLIPGELRVSNREILPLRPELEELATRLAEITVAVTVIQGEDDALVPAANADYVARRFSNAPVDLQRIDDTGHLIPWQKPELIRDAVLRHLEQEQPTLR